METFRYLGNLLKCAENIMKIDTDAIDLEQEGIKDLLAEMETLRKNITKINYNENLNTDVEIFVHYYNMVTLKEPKVFYKTISLMNKYKKALFEIYTMIRKIDAYISIASYKDGLDLREILWVILW